MKFEEYLDEYGTLTYKNKGISMMPLIKEGRDVFTVEKYTDRELKKYDVVLYKRGEKYVLHRIIAVDKEKKEYIILGDNCVNKEYHISDSTILAVMTSYIRKGKKHNVDELHYRIYSHIVYWMYPFRRLKWKLKRKLKALIQ